MEFLIGFIKVIYTVHLSSFSSFYYCSIQQQTFFEGRIYLEGKIFKSLQDMLFIVEPCKASFHLFLLSLSFSVNLIWIPVNNPFYHYIFSMNQSSFLLRV